MIDTNCTELYKRHTPSRWEDLIGQEKVARSLQSSVLSNKLPTAFLFTGPRGTGKTSAAKLLAKSLNCLSVKNRANPCNECEVCEGIDDGSQLGFNYLSMANAGGVSEVREIVKQARLNQPIRKQVWILDEVHNLSKAAFDSLLIPIEEKDMPSLFIMCSTEIDKIPATITSRIPARKFNLVQPDAMRKLIGKVAEEEGLTFDAKTVEEAIRLGRGSVRDTLTRLDTLVDTGDEGVDFGSKLLDAFGELNVVACLSVIAEASRETVDFVLFAEQFYSDLRDAVLKSSGVDCESVLEKPDEYLKKIGGMKGALFAMNQMSASLDSMAAGVEPQIAFESGVIKSALNIKKATSR